MISFNCPSCGANYEVDDDLAGHKASCDNCGVKFIVPSAPTPDGASIVAAYADAAPYTSPSLPAVQEVEEPESANDYIPIRAPKKNAPPSRRTGDDGYDDYYDEPAPHSRTSGGGRKLKTRPRGKTASKLGAPARRSPRRQAPVPVKKSSGGGFLIVLLVLVLALGGGGFVFYKKYEKKKPLVHPLAATVEATSSAPSKPSVYRPPANSTLKLPSLGSSKRVGADTPVGRYGTLRVKGSVIVGEDGRPVTLRGMSLFHCMDGKKFYNEKCVKWLRDDWKCDVVRIAIMTDLSWPNSWANEPEAVWKRVETVADACIKYGLYFIVDYHGGGDPRPHTQLAKKFFKRVAVKYGDTPNLIYETFNEPYGNAKKKTKIPWSVIKAYQESVIGVIRSLDSDNIIMVGTPVFCLFPSRVLESPLRFKNIIYVAHCYAATHKQGLRNEIKKTLDAGYPVFLTEFGSCECSGDGKFDVASVREWMAFMDKNHTGWCNWSLHDKVETASALLPRADAEGGWPMSQLSPSGKLIRSYLRKAAMKSGR